MRAGLVARFLQSISGKSWSCSACAPLGVRTCRRASVGPEPGVRSACAQASLRDFYNLFLAKVGLGPSRASVGHDPGVRSAQRARRVGAIACAMPATHVEMRASRPRQTVESDAGLRGSPRLVVELRTRARVRHASNTCRNEGQPRWSQMLGYEAPQGSSWNCAHACTRAPRQQHM